MITCKLCNREFQSYRSLATHIQHSHDLGVEGYYVQYLQTDTADGTCRTCGRPTAFKSLADGYRRYCSASCSNKNEAEQTRKVEIFKSRFGVSNPMQLKAIQAKAKATNLQKYGSEYTVTSQVVKQKILESNTEKFGGASPFSSADVRAKAKSTLTERYGVENIMQHSAYAQKSADTFRRRFVDSYTQRLSQSNCTFIDLDGTDSIKFKCNACNTEQAEKINFVFADRVDKGITPCTKCYPKVSFVSRGETEIKEYLSSLISSADIVCNDRSVLHGKELDIYIPSRKLAIEYDGLYYHREDNVGALYHKAKTEECEKLGIRLIHIFESEWESKRDIVKSRLASILGYSSRVYARRCDLRELCDRTLVNAFVDANHIQGKCNYSKAYGLYFNEELLAVMTVGASRFRANESELLRYCCKLGYTVVGGASRLLSRYARDTPALQYIVSYADRRWSTGNLYRQLGFTLDSISDPSYFYSDGRSLENRMKFQKQTLVKKFGYSQSESEREMMARAYPDKFRIFDCGQYRFVKRFSESIL